MKAYIRNPKILVPIEDTTISMRLCGVFSTDELPAKTDKMLGYIANKITNELGCRA